MAIQNGPLDFSRALFLNAELTQYLCGNEQTIGLYGQSCEGDKDMMDYLKLLRHSFAIELEQAENPPENHLVYLSDHIFDFTTYDSDMSELFASKAVDVCDAINNGTTYEYIKDPEQYKWFLLMCNMPFFEDKLSWGGSIRGAWWDMQFHRKTILFESSGIYVGYKQVLKIEFNLDGWKRFISAVIVFGTDGKGE